MPTADQLNEARERYEENEPRDLFYRVGRDLVERTRAGQSDFTLTEAVGVVLLTWNGRFYNRKDTPDFDAEHIANIDALIERYREALDGYHGRSIETLKADEQEAIEAMFNDFDLLLGPVGAAKALHVLAPRFFALWDRPIAEGASFYMEKRGGNANLYWRWMLRVQGEARQVGGEAAWGPGLLKRLDELNYCRFTIKVM
ncbi:MAG: hypothetical protein JWP75_3040 [Frondihabitans sp.]|nr:hypothetical protein [Frondihabitans sp.]